MCHCRWHYSAIIRKDFLNKEALNLSLQFERGGATRRVEYIADLQHTPIPGLLA